MPDSPNQPYDMLQVIGRIFDHGLIFASLISTVLFGAVLISRHLIDCHLLDGSFLGNDFFGYGFLGYCFFCPDLRGAGIAFDGSERDVEMTGSLEAGICPTHRPRAPALHRRAFISIGLVDNEVRGLDPTHLRGVGNR